VDSFGDYYYSSLNSLGFEENLGLKAVKPEEKACFYPKIIKSPLDLVLFNKY
jgi:hypothetical protein